MIAPFPSLTEICYSDVLHAPPLPGVIDQYLIRATSSEGDPAGTACTGIEQPWERRLDYHAELHAAGLVVPCIPMSGTPPSWSRRGRRSSIRPTA